MAPANPSRESPELPPARRVPLPDWRDADGQAHAGITLSVHEAGTRSAGRPSLVLCHGFPELAYSWRHQVQALAASGFHVLAPDMRGFGGSDRPDATEAYGIEHLAADLAGLLDAYGLERAVFAGHDWGGFVVWAMPLLHRTRTAGVIGVNTPYVRFPPTESLRRVFVDDTQLYILWFQQPGVAEKLMDAHPRRAIQKVMRRPARGHGPMFEAGPRANPFLNLNVDQPLRSGNSLLSDAELDVYASAFARTGFAGGIRWYRNIDANAKRVPGIGRDPIDLPCLMITAEWDAALPPSLATDMKERCSDLETHMIPACGHWTQQEEPEALNRLMIDWLTRRFSRG